MAPKSESPKKGAEPAAPSAGGSLEQELRKNNKERSRAFNSSLFSLVGVFTVFVVLHILGTYLFLGGFLLTRLVLDEKSACDVPPTALSDNYEAGSVERGCWYPKKFDKAVVIVVDALRYDFTVPFRSSRASPRRQHYHEALPLFYQTSVDHPKNSILLPFIADPPTTTLQRLKGLTTGSLPTFIDAGSNFAGTAIDEDKLIAQLRTSNKTIVHLGDDTWHSLFPGYFDEELTRSYDSFNVWDLFTVDNGVTDHIFPLLHSSNATKWDVIIGHYLGVDHAGHRYGPDHPAMGSKLKEMNNVFTKMMDAIDDQTLLVVMGDHGMDSKGDHGGESDDEVEAAIWLYSKREMFGRIKGERSQTPLTAKERPVRQIDLVPTLSLLLGLPIPYNNLGRPIDEAFISRTSSDWPGLVKAQRLASAQIHRYQEKYTQARNLDTPATRAVAKQWNNTIRSWDATQELPFPPISDWHQAYTAFATYQRDNLKACRDLWTRFDELSITNGIFVLGASFLILLIFARGLVDQRVDLAYEITKRSLLLGLSSTAATFAIGLFSGRNTLGAAVYGAAYGMIMGSFGAVNIKWQSVKGLINFSFWSVVSTAPVLLLCVGFAANSFTIWEDEILLYFLVTLGVLMAFASMRQADKADRFLGVTQAIGFIVFTRAASFSRLCREEQMPYCKSTYYASATSSTSSKWQLAIPFVVAALLPGAVRDAFFRTQNYHGSAALWIGIALRIGMALSAIYWAIDAIDDNGWFSDKVSSSTLKSTRVRIAQLVFALAYAAGYSTYVYSGPFIKIEERAAPAAPPQKTTSAPVDPSNPRSEVFTTISTPTPAKPQIAIFGYANTLGTRYLLLLSVWILPLVLVTKPMGQGTLSLLFLSILALLEVLDAASLRHTPLGPVALALLGQFHFFKTGHSATLSSIQWESAFIPLTSVRYPWSPLLVLLNSFAPLLLTALAVPAIALWKAPPRSPWKGLLEAVARDLATFFVVLAAFALATVVEASWLRRHLMLYRIFMPRMLLAVSSLLVVEVFAVVVGLVGLRWAVGSVADVFGWG